MHSFLVLFFFNIESSHHFIFSEITLFSVSSNLTDTNIIDSHHFFSLVKDIFSYTIKRFAYCYSFSMLSFLLVVSLKLIVTQIMHWSHQQVDTHFAQRHYHVFHFFILLNSSEPKWISICPIFHLNSFLRFLCCRRFLNCRYFR